MTAVSDGAWDPRAVLAAVGSLEDSEINIADAGLALAALGRQRTAPEPYQEHLAAIGTEMQTAAANADCNAEGDAGLFARGTTLSKVLAGVFTYQGDRATYDDLQNANLMHVIDRRKGLPVALAILYIHAARSQGWAIEGVNFPGHFVVRLVNAGRALILDPSLAASPAPPPISAAS